MKLGAGFGRPRGLSVFRMGSEYSVTACLSGATMQSVPSRREQPAPAGAGSSETLGRPALHCTASARIRFSAVACPVGS